MTPQPSTNRRSLPWLALAVCAVVWAGGNEALAGCGSYLLPPVTMAAHEQLPKELRAGKLYGRHNEAPCRGPRCQSRLPEEPIVPVAPPVVSTVSETAACPAVVVFQRTVPPLIAELGSGNELVISRSGPRLERPPCA